MRLDKTAAVPNSEPQPLVGGDAQLPVPTFLVRKGYGEVRSFSAQGAQCLMVGPAQACNSVVAEVGFGPDSRESGHHRVGFGLPCVLLLLGHLLLPSQALDEQTRDRR